MALPQVLDPASSARMMWFDKKDPRALFGDIEPRTVELCDGRGFAVDPDQVMDFRCSL